MSIKTKSQLKAQVTDQIPVGGQPAKINATNVRNLLKDVIDSSVSTINNQPPDENGNINLNLSGAEEITHADLRALKLAGELVTGKRYILTDYKTVHRISGTTVINSNTPFEKLILTASSSNTFSPDVYSVQFPGDVLRYDIDNIVCEDNATSRNGFITYRKDTILNNEVEGFDFRNCLFARYPVDAVEYDAATTYSYGSIVKSTANNRIYIYRHFTSQAAPITDSKYWASLFNLNDGICTAQNTAFQLDGVSTNYKIVYNTQNPKYFPIFAANRKDASITGWGYHEWKGKNISIKNTQGVDLNAVIIATNWSTSTSNDASNFNSIDIKAGFTNSTIHCLSFNGITIGANCKNNLFYGNSHHSNTLAHNTTDSFFGDYFCRNHFITGDSYKNIYTRLFADNTVHGYLQNSIFAGFTQGNDFGLFCGSLSIGHNAFGNTFAGSRLALGKIYTEDGFMGNNLFSLSVDAYFGASCMDNKFLKRITNSYFAADFKNNTFIGEAKNIGSANTPLQATETVFNHTLNPGTAVPDTVYMSKLAVLNLPIFDDNATALAAGLSAGLCYRTTAGDLKIVF